MGRGSGLAQSNQQKPFGLLVDKVGTHRHVVSNRRTRHTMRSTELSMQLALTSFHSLCSGAAYLSEKASGKREQEHTWKWVVKGPVDQAGQRGAQKARVEKDPTTRSDCRCETGVAAEGRVCTLCKRVKHSVAPGPIKSTPRHRLKTKEDTCPHKNPHTEVPSSTIHSSREWKQPTYPSRDERANQTRYILAVEYYSAIKRNEPRTRATAWMYPENIMQWERNSAVPKTMCCMILFIGNVQSKKIYRHRR